LGVNFGSGSLLSGMRWLVVSVVIVVAILVPFVLFEDYFNALADQIASGGASRWYAATTIVGLLSADVFLPVPSSVVSAAGGVLLGFWWGSAGVWVGMTLSCVVGYWVGARASGMARRFVGADGLRRATDLAARYGSLTLVLCRPVPVLAEASVVVAGLIGTPVPRFLLVTSAANVGVAVSYAAIGAYSMRIDSFLLAFLGAIVVPGIAALVARLRFGSLR
jgi:uncharacterized membrane protein YdjX (TVP38/TMEM64 family)